MTASFNPDGNSSAPVVVQLNPPFGGTTITWSFVVLNATGHQVGTGTAKLPNNDPANVPHRGADHHHGDARHGRRDTTVFTRTVTTTYDPTVSGYTWAPRPADTATTYSGGIQEVTGVTIATRLGVVGVVWKANDQYYLRGVPIVQNGTTITSVGATRQGFARRPFLLFDAFVGDADVGNHVLLEPDDTTDAYHIRALTIDPTNGALTWDSAASLGDFDLPIDAAALHSSGRVIAVHTDSGRLSHLMPAATPRPPRATYSAGPGTEIGLLSSPIAVAVTNPGTVLDPGKRRLPHHPLPTRRVRPERQPQPLLRHRHARRIHPAPTHRPHLPRPVRRRRQRHLPAVATPATTANPTNTASTSTTPTEHPWTPKAPEPTSPTSPSTTGAASTPPTTPPSSTPPPANPTTIPPSPSPNHPSAAGTHRTPHDRTTLLTPLRTTAGRRHAE